MRGRTGLAAVALLAVTACGSTVAPSGTVAGGSGGALGSAELGTTGTQDGSTVGGSAGGLGSDQTGPGGTGGSTGVTTGPAAAAGTTSAPVAGSGAGGSGAAPVAGGKAAPVSVGFVVEQGNGQQANESAGVSTGQTFTLGRLYRSLVNAMNRTGGLAGRRIEPVFAELNPAAASYDSELAAACATFTEDNEVAAVADTIGYSAAYEQCLTKGGAFHVSGSSGSADAASLSKAPALMSVTAPAVERRERAVIEQLAAAGMLTRGTKVGVVVDSCPDTRIGYEKAFKPAAEKAGLVLTAVEVTCASGYSDLGPLTAALQNAVLRFQSSGVTVVSFVTNVGSTEVLLFGQAAESQGYRPGYALTSNAQPVALALNLPQGQLKGMRGVGWLPSLDVAVAKHPPRQAPQTRCLSLLKSEGVVPTGEADYYLAYTVCETVFALERMLQKSGGASDLDTLVSTARGLGTSYAPVSTFATRFAAGRLDAPSVGRTFRYATACSCFEYDGALKQMD